MKKIVIGILLTLVILVFAVQTFATSPFDNNLLSNNWRVYNVMPATSKFWDINKANFDNDVISFPFEMFLTPATGSFAVYLKNNYNNDLTDKTITAEVNWTSGEYVNRGTGLTDAYVRLEFQDEASGNYTSNSYWWFTGTTGPGVTSLNGISSATLTGDLSNRALWTNICGQRADDDIPHPGANCVGGTDPEVSPFDGFTNAMKNVKEVNLSFGRASRYASGVAVLNLENAVFNMTNFTVTP